MVARRSLLAVALVGAAAAAVGGAAATDRLDDALRAAGVRPHPEPAASDLRLRAQAVADLTALRTLAADHPDVGQVVGEQISALGAPTRTVAPVDLPDDLGAACESVAAERRSDAERAVSPELAVVLASIAAGLTQCAEAVDAA